MIWYLKSCFSNNLGPILASAAFRHKLNQIISRPVNENENVTMFGVNNLQTIVTAVVSALKSYNESGSGGSVGRRSQRRAGPSKPRALWRSSEEFSRLINKRKCPRCEKSGHKGLKCRYFKAPIKPATVNATALKPSGNRDLKTISDSEKE